MKTIRVFKLKRGKAEELIENFTFGKYYIGVENKGNFIVKDDRDMQW